MLLLMLLRMGMDLKVEGGMRLVWGSWFSRPCRCRRRWIVVVAVAVALRMRRIRRLWMMKAIERDVLLLLLMLLMMLMVTGEWKML